MKKILLATALAAVSISATEAKWDGFYARGGLSGSGVGTTLRQGDKPVAGEGFSLAVLPEFAVGWGMTAANVVYLGVDAQFGSFGIAYHTSGVEGETSAATFTWAPTLQARVGFAGKSCLPYIASGVGYQKLVSATGVDTLPDGKMTWSVRVGSDFKVTDNVFVGVYGQFVKEFNKEEGEGNLKRTTGNSGTVFGFTAGYQF